MINDNKSKAKSNFRPNIFQKPNLRPGQLLKPGHKLFGANFGAKIEARPTFRPGQTNGARPGFIVCLNCSGLIYFTDVCPMSFVK